MSRYRSLQEDGKQREQPPFQPSLLPQHLLLTHSTNCAACLSHPVQIITTLVCLSRVQNRSLLRPLSFFIRMLQVNGPTLLLHRLLQRGQQVFELLLLGQNEIQLLIQPGKDNVSDSTQFRPGRRSRICMQCKMMESKNKQ